MTHRDKSAVRRLVEALLATDLSVADHAEAAHPSWVNLDDPDRRRGRMNLVLIRRALRITAG